MGAGQSNTRRLIIPNDDKTGVIKVSDSVVERIKGGVQQESTEDARKSPSQTSQTSAAPPPLPVSQQQQQYIAPPVTSLQILQDKDNELKKNDQYWEQRLNKLQENHRDVNRVLEEEYMKATREVAMKFAGKGTKNDHPPCQDMKACVLECYRSNPTNTLACAKVVRAFTSCVDTSRIKQSA